MDWKGQLENLFPDEVEDDNEQRNIRNLVKIKINSIEQNTERINELELDRGLKKLILLIITSYIK